MLGKEKYFQKNLIALIHREPENVMAHDFGGLVIINSTTVLNLGDVIIGAYEDVPFLSIYSFQAQFISWTLTFLFW